MRNSSDDFGAPLLTKREIRGFFILLSAAVLLLLLFGVGLAIRLQSSADQLVGETGLAPVAESVADSATGQNAADTAPEEISTDRAVRPIAEGEAAERYGVRVGIFAQPENSDRMLLLLQAEGYAPFVVFQRSLGQTLRYVYAVTAPTEADAAGLAAVLEDELGLSTHVEVVAPGG